VDEASSQHALKHLHAKPSFYWKHLRRCAEQCRCERQSRNCTRALLPLDEPWHGALCFCRGLSLYESDDVSGGRAHMGHEDAPETRNAVPNHAAFTVSAIPRKVGNAQSQGTPDLRAGLHAELFQATKHMSDKKIYAAAGRAPR